MNAVKGYLAPQTWVGFKNETGYLKEMAWYRGETYRVLNLAAGAVIPQVARGGTDNHPITRGVYVVPNYYAEMYNRVVVQPQNIELGNMSSPQGLVVNVWNAFRHAVTLRAVSIDGDDGVRMQSEKYPLKFNALAMKKFTVNVEMNGPALLDCTITFHFIGKPDVSVKITGSRTVFWQFAPDWDDGVTETLEFLTTIHQSLSGAEQRVSKRLSPRRTFEFKVAAAGVELQRLESQLYALGARVWQLPVFTDNATLLQYAQQGAQTLFCPTSGFDFFAGGSVQLIYGELREQAEVESVSDGELKLKRGLVNAFPAGTTVYPLRAARLTDMPTLTRLSDGVATAQVRFQVHEHNQHAAAFDHLPSHLGLPVLEPTSDWSEDITTQYVRMLKELDNNSALPHYTDTANLAFRLTAHRFVLSTRAEHNAFRRLLYALRGRQKAIWVASGASDLTLYGDMHGRYVDVENIGYSANLFKMTGKQDIRIECADGSIHYRRIYNASSEGDFERLIFDGDPLMYGKDEVLKISFLTLSRLDSDTVELLHHTDADGIAEAVVNFRGLRDELEGITA